MKTKVLALFALIMMMVIPSMALAQVKADSVHLSIMPGGLFPDSDLNIDDGMQYSVGLGYNFTENWGVELMGSYAPGLDIDEKFNRGDADVSHMRANAVYHFGNNMAFVPYMTAGIGGFWAHYDNSVRNAVEKSIKNYNAFSANAGVGFKYFFNETVALRVEANNVHAFKDGGTDNLVVNGGLTFQFGGNEGCIDSDNDGVCDAYDKCPGTPEGYRVDADGCPVTESITLDVKFDFDKSVVKPEFHNEIGRVAEFMKMHPRSTTVVEGHTDSIGSDEYNKKLSDRRAHAVRDALVSVFGVDPARLSAVGYGEERPIATNDTDAGRAQNRRVVGVVTGLAKE
ncbi:porin [Deltaproteobacteria bacterium Smac51]|nr:porin [Deltaproteobacteria bacterium Smac51]